MKDKNQLPVTEPHREYCKHCGLRIYLDKTMQMGNLCQYVYRHHASNIRACYGEFTFAEPRSNEILGRDEGMNPNMSGAWE